MQGVEKLAVTKPDSAFLEGKYKSLPALTLLQSLDLRFKSSQFHKHVALAGTCHPTCNCYKLVCIREDLGTFLSGLYQGVAPQRDCAHSSGRFA